MSLSSVPVVVVVMVRDTRSVYMISVAMESIQLSVSISKDSLMARVARSINRFVHGMKDSAGRIREKAGHLRQYDWNRWQRRERSRGHRLSKV